MVIPLFPNPIHVSEYAQIFLKYLRLLGHQLEVEIHKTFKKGLFLASLWALDMQLCSVPSSLLRSNQYHYYHKKKTMELVSLVASAQSGPCMIRARKRIRRISALVNNNHATGK